MKDNDKRCEHAHKEHINRFKMAHNIGVAEYMRENAEKYGLPADEMYVMGLLHDIGYIKQHKGHEEYGAELLETMGLKPRYVYAIKYHGLNPDFIKTLPYKDFDFDTAYKTYPELVLLYEADMSINARGYRVGFDDRLRDIGNRYGFDSTAYHNAAATVQYVKNQENALATERTDSFIFECSNAQVKDVPEEYSYVCASVKNDNIFTINEFSVFANIVDEQADTITIEKATNYGLCQFNKPEQMNKKDFEEYYVPFDKGKVEIENHCVKNHNIER